MKRYLRVIGLACFLAAAAVAQEHEGGGGGEEGLTMWKWANFVLLAGALGYGIAKGAPPFFAARSQSIRKDIVEAQEAKREADERAAAVEKRLANLEAEIAALRKEAVDEDTAETQSVAQHTAAEIAKIQQHAEQEIAAAGKLARLELKGYAAELAIEMAERKVRSRMTPATQDSMVRTFVRDLK
jgi:F-type H+-transporting ATPase subunit b